MEDVDEKLQFVFGEGTVGDDVFSTKWANRLAADLPDAEQEYLDDAYHWVMQHRPEAYRTALEGVLDQPASLRTFTGGSDCFPQWLADSTFPMRRNPTASTTIFDIAQCDLFTGLLTAVLRFSPFWTGSLHCRLQP